MVVSFHPQVVDQEGRSALYTQDTYRIGKKEGMPRERAGRFYSGVEEVKTA